jgi:hypothetical protein
MTARGWVTGEKGEQRMADLYEDDVVAWSEQQAALLRARSANDLDWDNIAEEISDVAQRQRDRIESRLAIACQHLLKWEFQPGERSNSRRAAIVEAETGLENLPKICPWTAQQVLDTDFWPAP